MGVAQYSFRTARKKIKTTSLWHITCPTLPFVDHPPAGRGKELG